MTKIPNPSSHLTSFVLRLTLELDGETRQWAVRGQIEQPQTGQSRRFVSVNDLPAILSAWLDDQLGGFPSLDR